MRQAGLWVDALKLELKKRGVTYAHVAGVLDLSEASVKRLFAEHSFSLDRLDKVCELAGIDLLELAQIAEASRTLVDELAEEQEQTLVDDPLLFLVGTCALNRWTLEDILENYDLTMPQVIKKLVQLDRMNILELKPGNRIRPLISKNFRWRARGPIQRYFSEKLLAEFLSSRFNGSGEVLEFAWGTLTEESAARVRRKIHDLRADFHQVVSDDENLPAADRNAASVLMAFRWYEPKQFVDVRRPEAT